MTSFGGASGEPPPPESEERLRVWLQRPDRMREELTTATGFPQGDSTVVQVGPTWWMLDERGASSNERSPEVQHGSHLSGAMLNPAYLLAMREFEITGHVVHGGREAIRVLSHVIPRDSFLPETFWPVHDAWPQELLVDAERGVLLRSVSLLDGEPFAITEFLSIHFDEAIPEERFVFEPPEGVGVRDIRERFDGLRPMSLDEAARDAPFTVFAVDGVRGDWTMRVHSMSGDAGYGWPASVLLHYANELSSVNININQHAADGEALAATAPDGSDWRVEQLENAELRLWEPSERERGMPRIGLTVIGGTRIQISTGDLDLDEIAGLAERLIPAPTEPPATS
jgi:outer membrane lipoprotein-sorting protein